MQSEEKRQNSQVLEFPSVPERVWMDVAQVSGLGDGPEGTRWPVSEKL